MKHSRKHRSQARKSSTAGTPRTGVGQLRGGANNNLRIIGGQWRGRKLSFASVEGLRPTGDRIRETLFNWLMPDLPGARCLDLFSGSGALGLEALSRGAAEVVMLDRERSVVTLLQQHIATLGAQGARVIEADALHWLQQQAQIEPVPACYHIVFLDPPFNHNLWQPVLEALEQSHLLADNAALYVEAPRDQSLQLPPQWQLHREKQAGQVSYRLYYRRETGEIDGE